MLAERGLLRSQTTKVALLIGSEPWQARIALSDSLVIPSSSNNTKHFQPESLRLRQSEDAYVRNKYVMIFLVGGAQEENRTKKTFTLPFFTSLPYLFT